jgi:hypothetical protein
MPFLVRKEYFTAEMAIKTGTQAKFSLIRLTSYSVRYTIYNRYHSSADQHHTI